MKRAVYLIFALVFVLILCACGAAEPAPETVPATTIATEPATEETTVPTTEATEPPTEETVPEGTLPDGSLPLVKVPTENGVKFIGDGLKITVENERELTVTLSNIEVRETYLINRAEASPGLAEAYWRVEIHGMQNTFEISTTAWCGFPGEENEMPLKDMDHALRYRYANGWSSPPFAIALSDTEAEYVRPIVSHTSNSITWQCTIPEEILDETSMGWEGIYDMTTGQPSTDVKIVSFPFDYEAFQTVKTKISIVFEDVREERSYTVQ